MKALKEGLHIGDYTMITSEVTKEMFAAFEEEVVHPTYSTVSMVYHMELVSRKLLLPYLETHEEGMGAAVTVKHIAPSGLGTQINATAVVSEINKKQVVTEVSVENEYGLIGKGEVKQAILPRDTIKKNIEKQVADTNLV